MFSCRLCLFVSELLLKTKELPHVTVFLSEGSEQIYFCLFAVSGFFGTASVPAFFTFRFVANAYL